jgi:hypothetical protein
MKLVYGMMFLLALTQLNPSAHAEASHEGKVDVEISLMNAKGKSEKVVSKSGDFRADWKTKKCEVVIDGQYAYCDLDVSRDLVNANGELIMKSMPQAHFATKTIDALISMLGRTEDKTRGIIDSALRDSQASRAAGFDLPFYTCAAQGSANPDCLKTGKDLLLFNAFKGNSYVQREIALQGGKLVFKIKLQNLKAHSASFHIIGNNNAGNFQNH